MSKDFAAFKFDRGGDSLVLVTNFNGAMAVCGGDDHGPVIITKKQAMKFFGLVESGSQESSND